MKCVFFLVLLLRNTSVSLTFYEIREIFCYTLTEFAFFAMLSRNFFWWNPHFFSVIISRNSYFLRDHFHETRLISSVFWVFPIFCDSQAKFTFFCGPRNICFFFSIFFSAAIWWNWHFFRKLLIKFAFFWRKFLFFQPLLNKFALAPQSFVVSFPMLWRNLLFFPVLWRNSCVFLYSFDEILIFRIMKTIHVKPVPVSETWQYSYFLRYYNEIRVFMRLFDGIWVFLVITFQNSGFLAAFWRNLRFLQSFDEIVVFLAVVRRSSRLLIDHLTKFAFSSRLID